MNEKFLEQIIEETVSDEMEKIINATIPPTVILSEGPSPSECPKPKDLATNHDCP